VLVMLTGDDTFPDGAIAVTMSKQERGREIRTSVSGETPVRKTPVMVADEHPIVRHSLAVMLNREGDLWCCGEAANLVEAPAIIAAQKPELLLLDLRTGNAKELELIKVLKTRFPSLRLLVISQLDERVHAEPALRAGAVGYVMKEQPVAEVLKAIRTVLAGEIYVSQKVRMLAVQRMLEQKQATAGAGLDVLTDRELHVFKALGEGKMRKEIAAELQLSIKTVETYCERIKHKLGLASGAQLTQRAAREAEAGGLPEGRSPSR
jgi:DNA-binding NarL/FixJ family response regulator